ncbi:MAG TPA: DUF4142 domain-containing protein [Pyrinomonadaceae bacterium]|jgi:putative membrane protein
MRRRLTFSFFIGFLAISLFGCSPADHESSDATSPNRNQPVMNNRLENSTTGNAMGSNTTGSTVNSNSSNSAIVQDNFWIKAAQSGMAEVELGKLAAQKATSPDVKKFAQMMVADHTKSNDELKALAAKKGLTLPTELDSAHKSMMEKLNGLSGAEFDKAYAEGQVDDHEAAVDLMDDNDDNSDADIKAFAAKSLPLMKSHLDMINGIAGKLK